MKSPRAPALLLAGIGVLALASACGSEREKPDNAVLDAHFNKMIADEEAERRRLIDAARTREDVRAKEMEQRSANSAAD